MPVMIYARFDLCWGNRLAARHGTAYLLSHQPIAIPEITIMPTPSQAQFGQDLSDRVRRLIYRASYTGMKETDLLLGHFAKTHLPNLDAAGLDDFEAILAAGDPAIYAWVIGNEPVPEVYDTPVFHLIKEFNKNA